MTSGRAHLVGGSESSTPDPIEDLYALADIEGWDYGYPEEENEGSPGVELMVVRFGRYCDYDIYHTWDSDAGALRVRCKFAPHVPRGYEKKVKEFFVKLNARLDLRKVPGCFELGSNNLPYFAYSIPAKGVSEQEGWEARLLSFMDIAINCCNASYFVIQSVGRSRARRARISCGLRPIFLRVSWVCVGFLATGVFIKGAGRDCF